MHAYRGQVYLPTGPLYEVVYEMAPWHLKDGGRFNQNRCGTFPWVRQLKIRRIALQCFSWLQRRGNAQCVERLPLDPSQETSSPSLVKPLFSIVIIMRPFKRPSTHVEGWVQGPLRSPSGLLSNDSMAPPSLFIWL